MKDRFETATGNLRADDWAKRRLEYKRLVNRNLALAKEFFARYPNLPVKQMDMADFRREFPEFEVFSVRTLKGYRTRLQKEGVL